MTRKSKIVYGDFLPNPTDEERRTMLHILTALAHEVEILGEDGMEPRAITVGLLVSAIKLAATSEAIDPAELRAMFDVTMRRYTEEGFDA